eukprot:TRINITY_DN10342_c0_g1_i2.p1 TRINITY_DN10342_c0_g1~~TRINITY_DN10342_c0_g1_i2.p1  ORF type:complete len:276 (-),score=35.40 TRINITY_DN10342_c0_g1_i2:171-998(-)
MSLIDDDYSLFHIDDDKFVTRIRNSADKFPSFPFSGYSNGETSESLLTSIQQLSDIYYWYRNKTITQDADLQLLKSYESLLPANLSYGIPKEQLYIKFDKEMNKEQRTFLANGIKQFLLNSTSYVWQTADFIETTSQIQFYLEIFFLFVGGIAIFLSIFLLYLSFNQNINEQYNEIGVLRAIGFTKTMIRKLFVFEALSLVLSSAILGSLVGITLAMLIVIQTSLFTELAPKFQFPLSFLIIILVGGILNAIVSPLKALKSILRTQISDILRGIK